MLERKTSASHPVMLAKVVQARDAITSIRLFQPQVAIVLGSGLGELAQHVEHATAIAFNRIPNFPRTYALGHAGQLILGFLAGVPVVLMQGRSHRYEGYANADVVFPVYCMQALGAKTLMATNAAGGLNSRFQTGDLMVLDSHINFLWPRCQPGCAVSHHTDQPERGDSPYDLALINQSNRIARNQNIVLHQGCYLATLGPTYETRAEYRMFRAIGADAVGMSTVPEVLAARQLSMRVLAFSVITNVASTDVPQSTTHTEVVDSGKMAGPRLMAIVRHILEEMAGQPD